MIQQCGNITTGIYFGGRVSGQTGLVFFYGRDPIGRVSNAHALQVVDLGTHRNGFKSVGNCDKIVFDGRRSGYTKLVIMEDGRLFGHARGEDKASQMNCDGTDTDTNSTVCEVERQFFCGEGVQGIQGIQSIQI